MDPIPYSQLGKGSLLIASPEADMGPFFRSVVLLCEHSLGGSFGLIINKALDIELPEEMLNLKESENPNVAMRSGGPIQPNQMMLLHSSDKIAEQTLKLCEGVYLGGDLQFLQEAISERGGPALRLCFGYCGWGAGELEREFLSGDWFLHPGSAKYVFETPPEKVWQTVLRDMGGKYATLSMIPEDLSLN
ncbi:MAG: YqgE/AlgH family protein [Verrucomicrobia bacterium]|nr:YqgE/AlgH family protein [Verrucomicrobiota bacterium]